jgi:hypothetical protein
MIRSGRQRGSDNPNVSSGNGPAGARAAPGRPFGVGLGDTLAAMRLSDSGTSVTLDLHGTPLAGARRLVAATVRAAASRGRASVRVIHGSSTSDPLARNATIKHELEQMLERGALPEVTGWVQFGDVTTLSLPISASIDPRPVTAREVW